MQPRLLVAALAAVGLSGCVPQTPYRYSAFAPSPQPEPWDGRGSGAGTLHLEGQAAETPVGVDVPALHASALWVPRMTVGGDVLLEVVRGVQIGVAGTYASYAWADITTAGTMPLPKKPTLFGIGPDMRVSFPLDREERVVLGLGGRMLYYEIPYAEWTLDPKCAGGPATCASSVTLGARNEAHTYQLTNQGSEGHFVGELSIVPSVGLGDHAEYGNVFGLGGITQTFHNDGFTDVRSGDGKIGTSAAFLVGGGYGVRASFLHVNLGLYYPITSGHELLYGAGGWLTVGLDPRLWEPKPRRW